MIALLLLTVMLTGCSTTVQTKVIKQYPDALWVQHTDSGLAKDMLSDYGKVREKALPQVLDALKACNVDKGSIREWMSVPESPLVE